MRSASLGGVTYERVDRRRPGGARFEVRVAAESALTVVQDLLAEERG
jgi:hypothetical protein